MVNEQDREDPNAIPNYLEKVFKQKEEDKFKRKMMGDDVDFRDKIKQRETQGADIKLVNPNELKNKKMEQSYI